MKSHIKHLIFFVTSISMLSANTITVKAPKILLKKVAYTRALARELASRNIRVNAIEPGYIDTDTVAVLGDEFKEVIRSRIPMGELGKPDDLGPLQLAWLGDAVWELHQRLRYCDRPGRSKDLHSAVVSEVKADAQAEAIKFLDKYFGKKEKRKPLVTLSMVHKQ